ncbi:NAD(P)-dependent dehydrogenase (short-subunit alcohol dehydrogenase family) [Salirhabdus euzebyi]|uniref:NAD(P)-dependent dehydrogenase (Short-subunit alcohol dehydrogenase family) n=1 Tax=Salirhabdus euzebyi TaxID=394506 RepID=A0A841Q334_9BACI|nr:SDR family oxidoreductase [Salirhabdus euzebyi]MBB6452418.1 NAD(P)-dependent dehydrogenase (short-subunit alcohol dehydrogenase family) [Salirhabdus euzebyi]
MRLEGKVAIVTGAASGMGKAIAILYAKEGAKVVASDINLDGVKETVKEIEENGGTGLAVKTNVASEEEVNTLVDQTVEAFGTVDILVNNAGIMDGFEPIGEISTDRFERVLAINTTSIMLASRKVMPIFLEKGYGVIVNNTSAAGVQGARGGAAYTASKHAAIGLTKNTAYMYAQKGIRANAIATGAVETNIASSMTNISEFGAARQGVGMPLNPRFGKPIDIANVALFLASDESSFVNGAVIAADAGWTAY